MKPIKQTVYLPVKVENKLPEIRTNTGMFVMSNIYGWDKLVAHRQMFIPKGGYYLNPQEGYFFTPEEFNEYTANVIKKALETAADKVDFEKENFVDSNNLWDIKNTNVINKQSITNTFEETFKIFGV